MSDEATQQRRPMRACAELRFIARGPMVHVLQQAWEPADGYGGMIEWRDVPTVTRPPDQTIVYRQL